MESPERNEEIEKVKAKQAEQWAKVVRQVGPPTVTAAIATQPCRCMPDLFVVSLLCRFRKEESRASFFYFIFPFHWLSFIFAPLVVFF